MHTHVIDKIVICIIACMLGYGQVGMAQFAEKDFVRYSVKDGLSDNLISCLQQDDQGYLWIGTDAGLNRFDGKAFKKFYQGTPPLHLASGSVWRLKKFGPDQLGIVSRGGFQLLNTKNLSVKNFIVPDTSAFSTYRNAAWESVELPGKSYAVTTASGFYVFDQDGKVVLRHDAYNIKDIGKKRILYGREFFKLSDRKFLVFVNEGGIALYDDEKKSFKELDLETTELNVFMHDRMPGGAYWVVRSQVAPDDYIFITYLRNNIIYYNHRTGKSVVSTFPSHMSDSLTWESKILRLNDTTFALNSGINGFYILKLDRKTGRISCDGEKYLRNYKIQCLFIDKDNRLWAGTTEGLLKQELNPTVINAYHFKPAGGKKYMGGFNCAFRHKDKLYVGRFSRSNGLVILNPVNMQLIKEVEFFGPNSQWNEIRTIEMYYPDTLWIGTNVGVLWYAINSGRYGKLSADKRYPWAGYFSAVLGPARDDGYAWIASMLGGKVLRYHIATRTFTLFTANSTPALPFEKVKHIVYDSYGDVWIGGHSLTRWNNRLQAFDTLITTYGGVNKFYDDILTMRADDKGSLWIHNVYNGLLEYRIREKRFISYTMKDGLPSDVLTAMSPVIDNKLWVAGNNQLSLFDIGTRQFTIYGNDDGLPEHRPTGRKIYFDSVSGHFYLFSNEHLVRFAFSPERKKDPGGGLLVEELQIGNTKTYYQPDGRLAFKYNENNLTISYSIIDFEKSNYQFAYRLDKDEPWNVVGNQRSIRLNNLPPGNYMLQLRVTGKPGFEKIQTLSFLIRPPFWKTLWFIGLAILVISGSIYFLYGARIRRIRQKANLDKLLSQTEMKALQSQMNPHFIFNSLNSIREMILNNENRDASHYLSKFAHLIRITLDQSSHSMVSLHNTVDYLRRYLEMENIRNSHFTYEILVDEHLDTAETFLPPMLIQPFIENALWHGVTASRKNIHIQIEFKKQGDTLVCSINDNGIGINQSQKNKTESAGRHKPHGISNIQTRVNLLNEKYDLHARVTVRDKKEISANGESGTLVTLYLPLEIKSHE